MAKFTVVYVDDFGYKHLTFATSSEVRFLRDRFYEVTIVSTEQMDE